MSEGKPAKCLKCPYSKSFREGLRYFVICCKTRIIRRVVEDTERPEWCPLDKEEDNA